MKKIIAAMILIVSALMPFAVFAAPGIPHQFYGTVTFESGITPNGLTVEAKVNGVVVGSSVIMNGKYGMNPDLLMALKSNGEWSGETAIFYVAGINTGETHILEQGEYTSLNLTVPGSVGVISKSATDTISNTTVVVTPSSSMSVNMGSALTVNIGSSVSTNSTIEKIEKLSDSFFSGATAVLSGNSVLNAYEIKITGTGLSISVVMNYNDASIDESTVKPYRFDGSSWVAITPFTRDTTANTITFSAGVAATPYVVFGSQVPVALSSGSSGGGGGGGGVTTPTTPTSPLSAVAQKVDANNQNVIGSATVQSVVAIAAPSLIPTTPKTPTTPTAPVEEPTEEGAVLSEQAQVTQEPTTAPQSLLAAVGSVVSFGADSVIVVGLLVVIIVFALIGYAIYYFIQRTRRKNSGKPR